MAVIVTVLTHNHLYNGVKYVLWRMRHKSKEMSIGNLLWLQGWFKYGHEHSSFKTNKKQSYP